MLSITVPINTSSVSPINDLGQFVSKVSGFMLIVAALASMLYLVWGGVEWILAGGDKGKVEEARHRITGAIIGLMITAVAWALFFIVDRFLGINIAGKTTSEVPPSSYSVGASSGGNNGGGTGGTGVSSYTTGSGNSAGPGTCGGGLTLGQVATLNGTSYKCVSAGTPCGSGNPNGFAYNFNCPTKCVNNSTINCAGM